MRNPHDAFDSNAIMVMAVVPGEERRKKGEAIAQPAEMACLQVGHIDKYLALELAPAMDRGEKWWAIATRVGGPRTLGLSLMLCRLADPLKETALPQSAPTPIAFDLAKFRRSLRRSMRNAGWTKNRIDYALRKAMKGSASGR